MTVILHNVDEYLKGSLSVRSERPFISSDVPYDINDCVGLFIDWIPTNSNRVNELVKQTEIIEKFVNAKKKIVIFDRYRLMTQKEFNYLKKHKAIFWEPALFTRKGFQSQSCWVPPVDTLELSSFGDKEFDLGYSGSLRNKFKGLSDYYEDMLGVMDLSMSLYVTDIKDEKKQELTNKGIRFPIGYGQAFNYKTRVLLGKPEDYVSGHLDPAFVECIQRGVIPVLPWEHKWYHAMFDGLVIKNLQDLQWIIAKYDTAGYGMIHGLVENIEKYHKEMTTHYVVNRILNSFR